MDLKPCPLCGSTNLYAGADNDDKLLIECRRCGVKLYESNLDIHLVLAWNRRSAAASEWIPISIQPEKEIDDVLIMCPNRYTYGDCYCVGSWGKNRHGNIMLDVGSNCPDNETYTNSKCIACWAKINLPK